MSEIESVEEFVNRLGAQLAWHYYPSPLADAIRDRDAAWQARSEAAERERDAALAENVRLREALERVWRRWTGHLVGTE